MPYKIFISTTPTADSIHYLTIIKRTLFNLSEFPIALLDIMNATLKEHTLEQARQLIDQSDIVLGLYSSTYGAILPEENLSYLEKEYQYAVSQNKTLFIFMPESARTTADERQQMFLQHVRERHIIHYFNSDTELEAKIKVAIANYRTMKAEGKTRLRPAPEMTFRADNIQTQTETSADQTFETMVNRAVSIAQDEIEQIVRRAIEIHEAQSQLQEHEPIKGLYVEDERDGLVIARPIWGEPLRRSQFQSDIFMVMPFRERFNAIYENTIRPVVTELNLMMKRGDDFSSTRGSIMAEVWAAIYGCKLVIVETTEVNANVYYELGIAHMLGKPAILLTQTTEVEQLPFDIRHLRFIVYNDTAAGLEKLKQDLHKSIIWILNDIKEQDQET